MPQLSRSDILERIARGEGLRGTNLVRTDLSGMDLSCVDLAEANLRMADLNRANLREARLTGCFLSGALMNEASLTGANLVESSMIGATLKGADLSRADLSGSDLTGANLQGAELAGAYLVGTFLNETDLSGANLNGAFVRMAQMAGSNLAGASLESADLSYADLSGVRLDGSCLISANLMGANLSGSTLKGCDLRGADLTGADLSGCNLTGAKLRDVKFVGVRLADAWAEWVDMAIDGIEDRASLEEVFVGIIGKPVAQLLVEGRVGDDVWAVILAHLCAFQVTHPANAGVRLRGIHEGISSSALYLEAEHEVSLAAYLAEFADIIGKGSLELYEQLAAAVAEGGERGIGEGSLSSEFAAQSLPSRGAELDEALAQLALRTESLQETAFWSSDKAVLILTGNRQIWLEATSNPSLTLRPPHGSAVGVDLVRGHFITDELRRSKTLVSTP
ncbi:MAG: pentapeptide repeat-containing protein [Acidobacteriota bacterium]